jgi:hypothetical protein
LLLWDFEPYNYECVSCYNRCHGNVVKEFSGLWNNIYDRVFYSFLSLLTDSLILKHVGTNTSQPLVKCKSKFFNFIGRTPVRDTKYKCTVSTQFSGIFLFLLHSSSCWSCYNLGLSHRVYSGHAKVTELHIHMATCITYIWTHEGCPCIVMYMLYMHHKMSRYMDVCVSIFWHCYIACIIWYFLCR